ncbi:MAG: uroporphyrinogen decarboxylase family protein [Bacillota bacterium]|nr:uroporphyrinogen decarboxylase family protein [Bacillota bacterium]
MNQRENMIRTIRFERPDFIPMMFHINAACWQHYDQNQLFDLMEAHPFLFPDFTRPQGHYRPEFARVARKDMPYTDDFGCVWQTTDDGITGTVIGHPLADWSQYEDYRFPEPETCSGIGPIDWSKIKQQVKRAKSEGRFTSGGLRHGHTFLQLSDLRGYQNLLYDMADDEPCLWDLIERLEAFNSSIIRHYVALEVDMVAYPEDLGMQNGPMLSPDYFRKYIKPSYQRLMKPARDSGLIVHMHSDGHLHDLIDDLIEGGVEVINLQDLVNGIDWITDRFAGKTCVDLDIDRQMITPFGTPQQVDDLVRTEVTRIGRKEGGLMMTYGLYPGTPIANVKAMMDAMERYAFYYS